MLLLGLVPGLLTVACDDGSGSTSTPSPTPEAQSNTESSAAAPDASSASPAGPAEEPIPDDLPPNLILISLDTCRADRLQCYGAERPTPAIDRFAEEAALFEDCQAQSCFTAPSHMSILTGQYVHRHGLSDNGDVRVPTETLATILAANGWRTAAFTGHGMFQKKYGFGEGFEVFKSQEPGTSIVDEWWRLFHEVYPDALKFLDEHRTEPCFVVVHGYDPHQPYWPPQPWRDEYAGWYEGWIDARSEKPLYYVNLMKAGSFTEEDGRYVSDLYDGEVANADKHIGKFLDELRERDLLDRSIVVFLSDHGESFGNGKFVGHVGLLDEVLAVPLMIRFPGGEYAGRYSYPTQLIDVLPTLLSALGLDPAPGAQGLDLMQVLRDEGDELDPARMRVAQWKNLYSVRFGERWKIMARLEGEGKVARKALYDMQSEAGETKSLMDTREGRKRYNTLLEHFLEWRKSTRSGDAQHAAEDQGSLREEDLEMLRALGYAE